MNSETDKDRNLLSLRFIGKELEDKAVSIYELGQTLISIQRIVNKAYLLKENRLESNSQLSEEEQQNLSLQIGSRFKKSDGYWLIPVLAHPATVEILKVVLAEGIKALGAYARELVEIRKEQNKNDSDNEQKLAKQTSLHHSTAPSSTLTSYIYREAKVLTERIDKEGNITNIEMTLIESMDVPSVNFNAETKKYVKHLESQLVLGEIQDIQGTAGQFDQDKLTADVRLVNNKKIVKVHLEPEDFHIVRYELDEDEVVTFTGKPIMKLGARSVFKEFIAHKIVREKKVVH